MSGEVDALVSAWESFSVPLRMRDGFDAGALDGVLSALNACAEAWRDSETIPRLGANVLVDMVPTMQALAGSYDEPTASRIIEASYAVQELVWKCVAVDPR